MSFKALASITQPLPRSLRDQILGYARSVSVAFFDIAREAKVAPRSDLHDQLVFIAGVKRLYSLVRADYWMIENTLTLLKNEGITAFEIGSQVLGSDTPDHHEARAVYGELRRYLESENVWRYVRMTSYREILEELASERTAR